MTDHLGRVLVIAGSDSGGGAGVQGDVKAITALGGHAFTAVTAVTVQNSLGVQAVHALPAALIAAQARAVLDDLGADVVKTGMLGAREVVDGVADLIASAGLPAVIDPVMVAKGGAPLLDPGAIEVFRARLVPLASLLTPNAPEAAVLTGLTVETFDDLRRAGERLLALGAGAVLMKGGHVAGPWVVDLLLTPGGETRFESGRIRTRHTHGTGCTLASACAALMAQGRPLDRAVEQARAYVQGAIRHAPGFGPGHGPLDHGWRVRQLLDRHGLADAEAGDADDLGDDEIEEG